MFVLFSLALLCCSLNSVWTETSYQDCGSKLGSVESVDVTGCVKPPCIMIKENAYIFNLSFKANTSSRTASVAIYATVDGETGQVPFPDSDLCKRDAKCPINEGDVNMAVISLPIVSKFPAIPIDIKLAIKADDHNENFICVVIPISIKEKYDYKTDM